MISSRLNRTREGNGFSLNKMICLSLFIHIVALSLIIFSPTVPSPKWTFGPVYSVQLVNLQDTSFRGNTASSLSKEILTPSPAPGAIVLKRPVETISSVPVRPVEKKSSIVCENTQPHGFRGNGKFSSIRSAQQYGNKPENGVLLCGDLVEDQGTVVSAQRHFV